MKRTSFFLHKETLSALLMTAGLYAGTAIAAPPAKVTICHIPPGNPANAHEITVASPAVVNAHMKHGDTMGACPPGVGAGAAPVVYKETNFAVCDHRQGETGRAVKVNKQGTVEVAKVQCD